MSSGQYKGTKGIYLNAMKDGNPWGHTGYVSKREMERLWSELQAEERRGPWESLYWTQAMIKRAMEQEMAEGAEDSEINKYLEKF